MPVKPAVKKETAVTAAKATSAKETARPARKATPRVSTARHRNTKTQDMPAIVVENSQEVVASIAYGYWEARGYQGGDAFDDWLRAEQEYQSRKTSVLAAAATA